jgi:polyribonucleotide nucleotidyltransferase
VEASPALSSARSEAGLPLVISRGLLRGCRIWHGFFPEILSEDPEMTPECTGPNPALGQVLSKKVETTLKVRVERKIGAQTLSFETGELAKQAAGSCLVQYGETVVLVAAATGPARVGGDFFPLTCDYRERVAAAGKFPGGFLKREGRPTTKEILTARLMDRPIRPQFPEWFLDEIQIQSFVLASDRQNDGDILAMNGASAALTLSPLPFQGPLGAVRLAYINGEFIVFPSHDQLEESDLDLIVSGSRDAILMIEGFARELPESLMTQAIAKAHEHIREICDLQIELAQKVNVIKAVYPVPEPNPFLETIRAKYFDEIKQAKRTEGKQARAEAVSAVKERAKAELLPAAETADKALENKVLEEKFAAAWQAVVTQAIRELILSGTRLDGRDSKTLRPISCSVDVLPRVHGSAVFQRGETQAMVTVTLGTGKDEQRVDGLVDEYAQKFMLHYYFPSFSVGEVRPIRGPGRREIGHGALAERSVKPVLPPAEDFPYTIRIISDILESNGSSSMATVCGSTLGLMAAGVPISNPVAGISIGLVKESDRWMLLTDIIGDEDHYGDMDFKVAGTQNGITGIQLDLKINGISEEIVAATLTQAREARIEILRKMLTAISRPRPEISAWAPRLLRTHIDPEKIGLLIGPGGKMIRAIQDATGASIEVEDDGTVTVASSGMEGAEEALRRIEALTATVEMGRIYTGRVSSIKDFGAFVEILPGKDGLCHISELAEGYVSNVGEICKVGDEMPVKVILIDDQDRVKLSRKAALKELGIVDDKVLAGGERPPRDRDREGGDRGDRGGDRGRRGNGRGRDRG